VIYIILSSLLTCCSSDWESQDTEVDCGLISYHPLSGRDISNNSRNTKVHNHIKKLRPCWSVFKSSPGHLWWSLPAQSFLVWFWPRRNPCDWSKTIYVFGNVVSSSTLIFLFLIVILFLSLLAQINPPYSPTPSSRILMLSVYLRVGLQFNYSSDFWTFTCYYLSRAW
jgi:hypothetical protein